MTREEVEGEIGFSLLDILEACRYSKDAITQIRLDEAVALYSTADELSPKVIVEIGARAGTSSAFLGFVAKKHGGKLYSIEGRPLPEWHNNMAKYGLSSFTELISAVSPRLDKEQLPFSLIDYLFIDATHAYGNVWADYRFWQPVVRLGRNIAFHDYLSYDGVKRAVDEIASTDKLKFVVLADGTETGYELGLIVFKKVCEAVEI